MILYPVDVFQVCVALETMFKDDPDLLALKVNVSVGELINEDPGQCPWLGIYRTGVLYPARTIGAGAGYRRNNVGLVVVTQQSSLESGRECARLLEELNQHVIRVLINDESLKGLVDTLDEPEVTYPKYGLEQNAYMQTSLVQFVGVRNVSAR